MSQKYVVVYFLDAANTPQDFPMAEWPLHVTLLANFRLGQINMLCDELIEYSRQSRPFEITADGEALFGPTKNIAVSLVRPDVNIRNLHAELLAMARKLGAVFDEPAYTGEGFRPHATIQPGSRLRNRQTVTLDSLTLVDMYPSQDIQHRKIIETYRLGM